MSQSRFVLKQVQVRGTGASDLTRYVAKGKLDREREGRKARPLFSERADDLTATQARNWLSITGGALDRADVLHYVLSFESAREYDLLGDDEDGRRREIVSYLRTSLDEALKTIGIAKMRWVAGIHRNTDNPHIHLLLNRNVIQKASGEITRIAKLPAPLVAHHQVQSNGERAFSYGAIINSFAAQTDVRHRERSRFLQFETRLRSIEFSRELLPPETLQQRLPTADEMMIGDWIIAEVNAVRAPQNSRTRAALERDGSDEFFAARGERLKLLALREKVVELDRARAERGQPLLAAFISSQNLRALLVNPPPPGARLTIGATYRDAGKTFESEREPRHTYDLRISNETPNLSRNQMRQEKELSPVHNRNERTR